MNKYNYYNEVQNDVENWLDDEYNPFNLAQFPNRDAAAKYLANKLWDNDLVTGNGGEYYTDEETCEEFLCHNLKLAVQACQDFGITFDTLKDHYKMNDLARYVDCAIRCYVLSAAIVQALITWEGYGFKYKNI